MSDFNLPIYSDERGSLFPVSFSVIEKHFGFTPKRTFLVYDVPEGFERGNHAHTTTVQILICLGGRIDVKLHDGYHIRTYTLNKGEYRVVDKMIWDSQVFYDNAILQVFCNTNYEETDYIRSFDEFIKLTR